MLQTAQKKVIHTWVGGVAACAMTQMANIHTSKRI
jgi:hypothetical protein